MSAYHRTNDQQRHDLLASKEFEQEVHTHLGEWVMDRTSSTTEIDFWVPGFFLDVKEKRQPLTQRWCRLPNVAEVDLMVLDELGVRKVMAHWPSGYFLLRDFPQSRMFLAASYELASVPRARVQRVGKGKLIYCFQDFRPVESLDHLVGLIQADLLRTPWKQSACVGSRLPEQV